MASQAIDLAAKDNTPQTHDCAAMFYDTPTDSLGLSVPVNDPAVQEGAFRIKTAKYGPAKHFKVGSAVNVNGAVILSNFVVAQPQVNFDCQPVLQYYVQTGVYVPGQVMNFSESSTNAALCDFTGGYAQALVSYKADGSWTVTMS